MQIYSIALHGGAGTITKKSMTEEKEQAYKSALAAALSAGVSILEKGGSALDAVEKTVMLLEDFPLFNAGRGSVFNAKGKHEMDAAIMDGNMRKAGAVAAIHNIKNPVSLARKILEGGDHVLLIGEGAMEYAAANGFEWMDEEYFFQEFRYRQWQKCQKKDTVKLDHDDTDNKYGTVGAVALDVHGNLAAATSTGGLTNKKYGRVGDSPVIGAGTYANNKTCAVSCTGSGEYFIRGVAAYDASCLMEYRGLNLREACDEVIHKRLKELGGDGGLVAVDGCGNIAMPFNAEGMYRACRNSNGHEEIRIFKDSM
jgi:beta-aspartyl-peptidase (threonine type)